MAIQMRRGAWSQFDPTKMLPGEWAVILSGHPDTSNGQALYHCFAAGTVKQIATIEDAATIIANATEDIREELTQDIASALAQVGAATNAANTATANANTATSAANAATQAATSASERAEDAIDAMGDISELAVPLMTLDTRGGAKLEEHGGLALRDGALGIGSLVQESDGYARGGLAEVTAKGHAEQASTTGKNLLPSLVGSSVTNGITATLNSDGSITLNGTATGGTTLRGGNINLDAGTYTLSIGTSFPSGVWVSVSNAQPMIQPGDTSKTATVNALSDVCLFIYIYSGISFSNVRIYPQLEAGSTATEYEPYTGGVPGPNPDHPFPIEVVRGRNLLDVSSWPSALSRYETSAVFVQQIQLAANTTYVVSTDCPLGKTVTNAADVFFFTTETQPTTSSAGASANSPMALTTGSDGLAYVGVRENTYANFCFNGGSYYIQLTLGSTPQPYVPYGHVGLEAQGRNLLDGNTENVTLASSGNFYPYRATKLQAGKTYTVSFASSINSGAWQALANNAASTSGQTILATVNFATAKTATFTPAQDFSYFAIFSNTGGTFEDIQLEPDTEATEYRPYYHSTTAIPLPQRGWVAGLPDGTADLLRLDGAGKCEWTLPTSEIVFDGSSDESWAVLNNGACVHTTVLGMAPSASGSALANALCTHFQRNSSSNVYGGTLGFALNALTDNPNVRYLRFSDGTMAMTVADWTTWLSTHNVTVLFPLATPVTEDCGYVDMPAIPSDATVTIRELDDLGIKYFIDDSILVYGRQMYQRARSEYADRLEALEAAVADLVTGA